MINCIQMPSISYLEENLLCEIAYFVCKFCIYLIFPLHLTETDNNVNKSLGASIWWSSPSAEVLEGSDEKEGTDLGICVSPCGHNSYRSLSASLCLSRSHPHAQSIKPLLTFTSLSHLHTFSSPSFSLSFSVVCVCVICWTRYKWSIQITYLPKCMHKYW